MRTILFYPIIIISLIWSYTYKVKLEFLKKFSTKEKVDAYVFKMTEVWSKRVLKLAGTKVNVYGLENMPEGNCLIVSNHQGNFDFFVLLGFLNKPIGFIAKKSILKVPIASMWMKEMHCVFMDRDNVREAMKSINEGIENLNNGYTMLIFPEGTRSKGDTMREFKQGSLKLGIKADVPIVPVTLDGAWRIHEANNLWIKPAEVNMVIGKPVYAKDLSKDQQKELSAMMHGTIKENLQKLIDAR